MADDKLGLTAPTEVRKQSSYGTEHEDKTQEQHNTILPFKRRGCPECTARFACACCFASCAGCAACYSNCRTSPDYETNTAFECSKAIMRSCSYNLPQYVCCYRVLADFRCPGWFSLCCIHSGASSQDIRGSCTSIQPSLELPNNIKGLWIYPDALAKPSDLFANKNSVKDASFKGVLMWFHGGAFALCHPKTERDLINRLAVGLNMHVLAVDYRRPPKFPVLASPNSIDDCFGGYNWLLEQGVPADKIVFGGDSAGGAMVMYAMDRARKEKKELPRAAFCFSPWVDLADMTSKSFTENKHSDFIPPALTQMFAQTFVFGKTSPLVDMDELAKSSAINLDDLGNLSKLHVEIGGGEVLRSQIERFCEKVKSLHGDISIHVEPHMPHVWQLFGTTKIPAIGASFERVFNFVNNALAEKTDVSDEAEA